MFVKKHIVTMVNVGMFFVTIWTYETLSQRARNVQQDKPINEWITPSGHFTIYGKKPSDPERDIPIGGVVLFYVSDTIKKIVGAGRIRSHNENSSVVYTKQEHNEYCVNLERVMFFDEPFTSQMSCMKLGNSYITACMAKGKNVVTRLCTQAEGTEFHSLCLNVLTEMENVPKFRELSFATNDYIQEGERIKAIYQGRLAEFKRAFKKFEGGNRFDVRTMISSPCREFTFSNWEKFRDSNGAVKQKKFDTNYKKFEGPVTGVYELGYVPRNVIQDSIRNEDVVVFYVGYSENLYSRLSHHVFPKEGNKSEFYEELLSSGNDLVWRKIEHLENKHQAKFVESQFLHMYFYEMNKAENKNHDANVENAGDVGEV